MRVEFEPVGVKPPEIQPWTCWQLCCGGGVYKLYMLQRFFSSEAGGVRYQLVNLETGNSWWGRPVVLEELEEKLRANFVQFYGEVRLCITLGGCDAM